jgi:2-keto-4-pentenoate hydratase/2-oxohepta-3-ene-1,7-dioic acid hydratase in catechol pathway
VPGEPSYFLKPPSSLARGGGPVARPAGCEYLNYEGEIAVVVGQRVRRVGVEEAAGAIGWLTAANDFGLYDLRWADRGSNLMAKGQDLVRRRVQRLERLARGTAHEGAADVVALCLDLGRRR